MFFFLADRRVFGEALKKPEKKIAENNLCSAFNSLPEKTKEMQGNQISPKIYENKKKNRKTKKTRKTKNIY